MSKQNPHANSLCDLIQVLQRLEPVLGSVEKAGNEIIRALKSNKKVLTAGNGGSAADALHLAEELVGRFQKERLPFPAICMASDPTLLTCIGNDYGFDSIFSRQIEALGSPGDVLVIFSTSGNSNNLNIALDVAFRKKLATIALLGKSGGKAKGKADIEIIVPSEDTAHIQEVHTFILHCWLRQIEADL